MSSHLGLTLAIIVGLTCVPRSVQTPPSGVATITQVSPYTQHHYLDQFPGPYSFKITPTAHTPKGVRVDTSGQIVDLKSIDAQIDHIDTCLTAAFGSPPIISKAIRDAAQCDASSFPMPIRREDLVVKIADNWMWSCDNTQQLIPSPPGFNASCEEKGLTPTPKCPCSWRAGIQANYAIVVTPNLHMLKDPIIRMITGCNRIWIAPIATCAMPET
jgi:hypothetical protein